METFLGILIPFLGTTLGAACVFFMKKSLSDLVRRSLAGFAAGVMVAASIWSLLIPAIEQSEGMGKLSFLPAFIGFWVGVLFLLLLDRLIPHLHVGSEQAEGPKSKLGRTTMMVLAVTLHNIPEGMAVGVMYAGFLAGNTQITAASALVLSLGIAIQNFPEGAIISMPLRAEGESKGKAFLGGVLSGVVEPIGAVLTLLAAQLVIPALPYLLSFAAGAMLYVVVEELEKAIRNRFPIVTWTSVKVDGSKLFIQIKENELLKEKDQTEEQVKENKEEWHWHLPFDIEPDLFVPFFFIELQYFVFVGDRKGHGGHDDA